MIGTDFGLGDVGEPCAARLEKYTGAAGTEREPWLVDCALNAGDHGRVHMTAAGQKFGSVVVDG